MECKAGGLGARRFFIDMVRTWAPDGGTVSISEFIYKTAK